MLEHSTGRKLCNRVTGHIPQGYRSHANRIGTDLVSRLLQNFGKWSDRQMAKTAKLNSKAKTKKARRPKPNLSTEQAALVEQINEMANLSATHASILVPGIIGSDHQIDVQMKSDDQRHLANTIIDDRQPILRQLATWTNRIATTAAKVDGVLAEKVGDRLAPLSNDRTFWLASYKYSAGATVPFGIDPCDDGLHSVRPLPNEVVMKEMIFEPLDADERFVVVPSKWDQYQTLGHDEDAEVQEWKQNRQERRRQMPLPKSLVELPDDCSQVFVDVTPDEVRPMTREAALFQVAHRNEMAIQAVGGKPRVGMSWSFLVELGQPLGDPKGKLRTIQWHEGLGNLSFNTFQVVRVMSPTKEELRDYPVDGVGFGYASQPYARDDVRYFARELAGKIDFDWSELVTKAVANGPETTIVINNHDPIRMQLYSELKRLADLFDQLADDVWQWDCSEGESSLDPLEEPRVQNCVKEFAKAIASREADFNERVEKRRAALKSAEGKKGGAT